MSEISRGSEKAKERSLYDLAIAAGRQALVEGTYEARGANTSHIDFKKFMEVLRASGARGRSAATLWQKYKTVEEYLLTTDGQPLFDYSEEELYELEPIEENQTLSQIWQAREDAQQQRAHMHEALITENLPQVLELADKSKTYGSIVSLKSATATILRAYNADKRESG